MNITFTATRQNQTFRTTLAGVTYPNLDGTNRQIILKSIRPGEQLRLERDSTNPHDKHAVAVFRSSGVQLGFIPAGDARLANHIDGGGAASARVVSLIGGPGFLGLVFKSFRKNYGCLIEVTKSDPDWKAITPYMEMSRQIEAFIETTNSLEDAYRATAISNYKRAIQDVMALDNMGTVAAAWRRARYPINRISLLLEREKDYQGALTEIQKYEAYLDVYGISAADQKSVFSRKERLIKRIADKESI